MAGEFVRPSYLVAVFRLKYDEDGDELLLIG